MWVVKNNENDYVGYRENNEESAMLGESVALSSLFVFVMTFYF